MDPARTGLPRRDQRVAGVYLEPLGRPVEEVGAIRHAVRDSLLEGQDPAIECLAGVDHALGERVELKDEVVDPETRADTQVDPGHHDEVGEHPAEAATVDIWVEAHEGPP